MATTPRLDPSPDAPVTPANARAVAAGLFAPPARPAVGLEAEWVLRRLDGDPRRPEHAELAPLLALRLPGGSRVTLEPGGQVELSTAPAGTVDTALDRLALDAAALGGALRRHGFAPVVAPVDRERDPRRILDVGRYRAMEAFFDARGPEGRWMMCNTTSLQVNVGHDPLDPARTWRLAHRLAPVLVAAFANSPGTDRAGTAWASTREAIWLAIDPGRTAPPPLDGRPDRAWSQYAFAADVMLVREGDDAVAVPPGTPFAAWVDGALHRRPTVDDLRYHLTTLFPPVRPRGWLELRVLDALPPAVREVAAVVVTTALHPCAAAAVERAVPEAPAGLAEAARLGLAHPALAEAADRLFAAVAVHAGSVTARPDRLDAVRRYRREAVVTGTGPAAWTADAGPPPPVRTRTPAVVPA